MDVSNGRARASTGNKRRKQRFFKLKWLLYLFVIGLILAILVFDQQTKKFRDRAEIYNLNEIDNVEVKSLILDRKGRELGRIFVENRDKMSIKDVPKVMINALVAGEDQRFLQHDGVDRIGVIRALYINLKAGRQTQGANTVKRKSSSFTSIAFLSAVASTASDRRLLVTLERSHVISLRWSVHHLWAASKTLPGFPRSIIYRKTKRRGIRCCRGWLTRVLFLPRRVRYTEILLLL